MKLPSIRFMNRDFSSRTDFRDLKFEVTSYAFSAIGGCSEAAIAASGGPLSMWNLINWLRFPVTIYDPLGNPAWWGYVNEVTIQQGALKITVSLDNVYNRVAVAYSYVEPGSSEVGSRKTTAWEDNLDSQAEFGVKELLSSTSGLSDAAAEGRRAAILAGQAWPLGGLSQVNSGTKAVSATLKCKGWWETLAWKYGPIALAAAISFTTNDGDMQIKNQGTGGGWQVFQGFTVGAQAINSLGLELYLWKSGAPTDNLLVRLYKFNLTTGLTMEPILASVTVAGTSLGTSAAWVPLTWTTPVSLDADTQYCLIIYRSGATDNTNYYRLGTDSAAGYAGGVAKISTDSGATYTTQTYDLDFKITHNNNVDSTNQIRNQVTTYGQFLTATDIEAPSGVLLPNYQDGDASALAVIKNLMAAGGANGRRLLASVDPNRRVQIREEPAPSTAEYFMDSQAKLTGSGGIAVNPLIPPVGVWCRLKDVLPGVVDLTKLVDPSLQFIESSNWSASGGAGYQFKGRPGVDSLLSIGG